MTFAEAWKRIEETHPEPKNNHTRVWSQFQQEQIARRDAQIKVLATALESVLVAHSRDCEYVKEWVRGVENECTCGIPAILADLRPTSTEVPRE